MNLMLRSSALLALCGAALVMVTACSNPVSSPSAQPGASVTGFSSLGGSTRASLSHYNDPLAVGTAGNPEISCPSQAPRIYHSGVLGLRIELQWQPIYNVKRYQVEVERRTFSGYVHVVTETVTDGVYWEVYGVEGGQYRLRVRSLICGGEGAWSDWVYESIEGQEDLGGGVIAPPGDPTVTYWFTDQGSVNSRESGCENLGQGSIGTYLGEAPVPFHGEDGGVCQIETQPGNAVLAPQPFWVPYDGPLP
jgi:hypothetical protein